jgi:cysteine synthase
MSDIRDGFVGTIGNTPLIRLRKASELTGCEILGKAEFLNPGGSVDDAFRIPDEEAVPIVFDLLREEGLWLGGSSGINVAGAIRLARQLGPGHTVVTILCDGGGRYQSKLYNPAFLREKGLPVPDWLPGAA